MLQTQRMRINEIRPTLSGDVPRGYAFSSITSLTCTHFDPTIFLNFRKNVVVSHRVNEPIYLVHGTSFVDKSILMEKNTDLGWWLVKSKNKTQLKLAEMRGTSLPEPIGTNIEHVYTKEGGE